MIKYVRLIVLFIAILSTGLAADSKESESPPYLTYVDEIVRGFAESMKTKHKLHCYGSGGSMPTDVEEIEVMFISYSHLTVNDGRRLEIEAIQDLLTRINSHEKIRPYLREYPFDHSRVTISISFRTETDDRPLDGSVALVFSANNKIFYKAAEMKMSNPVPMTYMNKNNEWITEIKPGELRETLTPILEETFEEAVKIAGAPSNPSQKQ